MLSAAKVYFSKTLSHMFFGPYEVVRLLVFAIVWISLIVMGLYCANAWLTPKPVKFLTGSAVFVVRNNQRRIDVAPSCNLGVTDGVNTIEVWSDVHPPIFRYDATCVFIGKVAAPWIAEGDDRVLAVRWPGPLKDITSQVAEASVSSCTSKSRAKVTIDVFEIFDPPSGIKLKGERNDKGEIRFIARRGPDSSLYVSTFGSADVDRWMSQSAVIYDLEKSR